MIFQTKARVMYFLPQAQKLWPQIGSLQRNRVVICSLQPDVVDSPHELVIYGDLCGA